MIDDIVCEADYPYAPADVWRVLVTPDALRAWLMETSFEKAEVGHRFRFTDRPRPFWDGVCECEVVEAEPERRFALLWGIGSKSTASRVSFLLAPTPAGGTRLSFRHSGLHGVMGFFMKKGMTKGWTRMVERGIPFVCARMRDGVLPTRDEVRAHST